MGFIFRSCMLLAFAIIMWGIVYLGYWVLESKWNLGSPLTGGCS